MKLKLESVTNLILALGTFLTALTGMYKEYNAQREREKLQVPPNDDKSLTTGCDDSERKE